MTHRRLLLLSNSTTYGGRFLDHAADEIQEFLGRNVSDVLFIPYAAVRISFDDYADRVAERFGSIGYDLRSVDTASDPVAAVVNAEVVVVGGGNTFQLLDALYRLRLLEPIRARVFDGMPYIGWSAGANVACPSIKTTNDMPIVEPPSLQALGLVPFQINPHFTDAVIPRHGGETRTDRLLEFVAANPDTPVIGLREGSMLRVGGTMLALKGGLPARVFVSGREPVDVDDGDTLADLLMIDRTT